ncbi:MAG: heavy metal-binding domain-containing protein [Armatimonadota bacterium]
MPMQVQGTRFSPFVVIVALLIVFGSGVVVGMKLSDRSASASTVSAPPLTEDHMKAGGGGCPMLADDAAKVQPAAAATQSTKTGAGCAMEDNTSADCPMSRPGAAKPAAKASPKATAAEYLCTMCPGVHASKPGACPKCGMALVKKAK